MNPSPEDKLTTKKVAVNLTRSLSKALPRWWSLRTLMMTRNPTRMRPAWHHPIELGLTGRRKSRPGALVRWPPLPPQDNVTTKRVDKKSLGLNRSAWQPIELNLWPKVGEFRKTWKWKFDNYNCKWSVQPKSLKKEVLPKNDYLFTWSVVGERNAPRKLYLHRRISHGTFKKFQNILWSVKIYCWNWKILGHHAIFLSCKR